jgi:hypothetical protein
MACARVKPPDRPPDRWGCYPKANYSPAQVTTILDLRDRGESLKAVARQVGGSKQDVRAVERQQRPRRRPRPVRDPLPPVCPPAMTAVGPAPPGGPTGP